jgi:argininosuccinate lyase
VQISSIMPQKRNPVPLEHTRILASRALFEANSVLGSLHNTPFADMNDAEDDLQPLVYTAFDDADRSLRLLAGALSEATFDLDRMAAAASSNFLPVTELADTLVRQTGISFHAAHTIVSRAVRELAGNYDPYAMSAVVQREIAAIGKDSLISLQQICGALNAKNFVGVRRVAGGPAAEVLDPELARAEQQLLQDREWLSTAQGKLEAAKAVVRQEADSLLRRADGR